VFPDEPLNVVPLAPSARFADNRQDRNTDLGQDVCVIAGHGGEKSRWERSGDTQVAADDARQEALDRELENFMEHVMGIGDKPKGHTWTPAFNYPGP
jgi:hypothetical protein